MLLQAEIWDNYNAHLIYFSSLSNHSLLALWIIKCLKIIVSYILSSFLVVYNNGDSVFSCYFSMARNWFSLDNFLLKKSFISFNFLKNVSRCRFIFIYPYCYMLWIFIYAESGGTCSLLSDLPHAYNFVHTHLCSVWIPSLLFFTPRTILLRMWFVYPFHRFWILWHLVFFTHGPHLAHHWRSAVG